MRKSPVFANAAYRFFTSPDAPSKILSQFIGVKPTLLGTLSGAVQSSNANAPELDVTQSKDYQRVKQAVSSGKSRKSDFGNWNPTTSIVPPTYGDSLREYDDQQAQVNNQLMQNAIQNTLSGPLPRVDLHPVNPEPYKAVLSSVPPQALAPESPPVNGGVTITAPKKTAAQRFLLPIGYK